MADFAATPEALAASAPTWTGLGEALAAAGLATVSGLEAAGGYAGDAGLSAALADAGQSAALSWDDVAAHVRAFGPALTTTAGNYEISDGRSAAGFRCR